MSKSNRSSQPAWNEEAFAGGAQALRELIKKPKSQPTTKDAIRRYVPLIDKAIEQGYDYQDIAQTITTGSGINVSVANLRRYYKEFQVSAQVGDGENQASVEQLEDTGSNSLSSNRNSTGRSKGVTVRSAEQPAAQKATQPGVMQVPDATESGRVDGGASNLYVDAPNTSASPATAKADTNPEPRKKLTALERLRMMSEDQVNVPDNDDEEAAAEPELVIRGNFSIMPKDEDL